MFKFIGLGSITGASKDFEAPIAPIAPLILGSYSELAEEADLLACYFQ